MAVLDTRWWDLSLGVVAASVVGCGPSILLTAETEGQGGTIGSASQPTGSGPCTTTDLCPGDLVCRAGQCVNGTAETSTDSTDSTDYSDYSDYSEYDGYYCASYGPRGECCDNYECPGDCQTVEDCATGEVCEVGFKERFCAPVLPLVPCPGPEWSQAFVPVLLDGEIISLSSVDADGGPMRDLVIGHADGVTELVRSEGVPELLELPKGAIVTEAVAANFTGDVFPDLVVATGSSPHLLLGGGAGFTYDTPISPAGVTDRLVVGNFDGGGLALVGRLDGTQLFGTMSGPGVPLFQTTVLFVDPTDPVLAVVAGDFGNDDLDDIAFVTAATDYVYFGGGRLGPVPDVQGIMPSVQGDRSLFVVELGVDSPDALVATTRFESWSLIDAFRPGVGTSRYRVPDSVRGVGAGDTDGDAAVDLVMAGTDPASPFLLFVRGGQPDEELFVCVDGLSLNLVPTYAVTGDFTGDGRSDVAVSDGTEVVLFVAP